MAPVAAALPVETSTRRLSPSFPRVDHAPVRWGQETTVASDVERQAAITEQRLKPNHLFRRLLEERIALGLPIVPAAGNTSRTYQVCKRIIDVVGALVLLLLCSPLLIAVFVVLFVTTRGKPIFSQVRLGRRGLPFRMLKFRTMVLDAEQKKHAVANEAKGPVFKNRRDPRVTRIGRILRRTSIDELPQLINVLLGHMSLVGPRPPIPSEVTKYEPWQLQRLSVKPGLTCLWQVSGRSEIDFDRWVEMDIWYVENQGLVTDLTLLAKTPWSVLTGKGAY